MIGELFSFFVELLELLTLIARHIIEMPLRLAQVFESPRTVYEADELVDDDPGIVLS